MEKRNTLAVFGAEQAPKMEPRSPSNKVRVPDMDVDAHRCMLCIRSSSIASENPDLMKWPDERTSCTGTCTHGHPCIPCQRPGQATAIIPALRSSSALDDEYMSTFRRRTDTVDPTPDRDLPCRFRDPNGPLPSVARNARHCTAGTCMFD